MNDGKSVAGLDFPDEAGFRQICDRLKAITRTNSERAMFEALGFKPNSAYAAVKKQQIQPSWIVSAVARFGASASWLIFGGGEPDIQLMPVIEPRIDRRNQIRTVTSSDELPFKREWLDKQGGLENLMLVRAVGDTMEPTICENSLVLVNIALNTPYPGAVFAMAFNRNWHFKRLHTEPGRLVMQSDNKNYPDIEVGFVDGRLPDDLKVIGRAVCWWHEEQIS